MKLIETSTKKLTRSQSKWRHKDFRQRYTRVLHLKNERMKMFNDKASEIYYVNFITGYRICERVTLCSVGRT